MTMDEITPVRSDMVLALRQASQELINQHAVRDQDALLGQLVAAAVAMVPAAVGGGITRTQERSVRSSHATSPTIRRLDQLQDRLGEGPCIDAADHPPADGTVLVDDLEDLDEPEAQRWGRFAPEAVAAGFRAMLSVSLTGQDRGRRSALNLYATTAHAFDPDARVVAGLFASHAGALLYGADQAAHLNAAISSRDVIGQAKGILMERFTVTAEEAFEMLVRSSQDTNIKLVDVARWLISEAEQRRVRQP